MTHIYALYTTLAASDVVVEGSGKILITSGSSTHTNIVRHMGLKQFTSIITRSPQQGSYLPLLSQ